MPELPPRIRKKRLKSLYRTCGRHALLPGTLKIPVCYDRTGTALYRGGYADVWKGQHCGRDVAVKVIRTCSNDDLQKIVGVSYCSCSRSVCPCTDVAWQRFCKEVVTWKTLRHPNVLPLIGVMMSESQFATISDWMFNGNINDFVKAHPDVKSRRSL
jgi:serine/threonine protein kinase